MLKTQNRFHGRVNLLRVFRSGTTFRAAGCSVRFVPNRDDKFRAGVVVSKKVSKSAVVRNRIRRRVYAYLSAAKPTLKSGDYVVSVFEERFATMPQPELESTLGSLLKKTR